MSSDSSFDLYQVAASSTAIYPQETGLAYLCAGLCGEAGELAGKISKQFRGDNKPISREDIKGELGDILWFLSELARWYGFSLHEVAEHNIEKLQSRKQRGVLMGNGDNR